jgi:hypothetical protein
MTTDARYQMSWDDMTDDQLIEVSKNAVLEQLNQLNLSKSQIKALQVLLTGADSQKMIDLLFDLDNCLIKISSKMN